MSSATSTFTLTTPDDVDLFTYCWLPAGQQKAVIKIAHGTSPAAPTRCDGAFHNGISFARFFVYFVFLAWLNAYNQPLVSQ